MMVMSIPATTEELSSAVTEDEPVLQDIDRAVEEASDTVCNVGIDIESVIVENDDSQDADERRVALFVSKGCKCQLNAGSPCSSLFTAANLKAAQDECRELTRQQMDMVVMGQLRALCHRDPQTQRTKAKNTDRQRTTTLFCYGGHRICQKVLPLPSLHE